jgi:CheY-like chemotaxis protein
MSGGGAALSVKILYVENDQEQADRVTSILEDQFEDVEAQTASDGLEGIANAREWDPDLVLLDLVVPQADGIEVISRLRHDVKVGDVPIVAISAWVGARSQFNEAIKRVGASVVFTKPIEAEQLANVVARYAQGQGSAN